MLFAIEKKDCWVALGLSCLSGLLTATGFPPFRWHLLAFVAMAPFLAAVVKARREGVAQLAGLGFGLGLYPAALPWFWSLFSVAAVLFWLLLAFFAVVAATVIHRLVGRWGLGPALALTPVVWVGIEYFRCEIWTLRFAWITPGLTQASNLPILQSASVVGIYGLSLLVVAVNVIFAWAVVARCRPAGRGGPIALTVLTILTLHWLGVGRLSVPAKGTVPVVLVQSEAGSISVTAQLHQRMPAGTRLAVWPEYATFEYADPGTAVFRQLADIAANSRCTLVAGCKESIPGEPWPAFYNAALVLGPEGRRLGAYHKANPVPFFRDGMAGSAFPTFATPVGRIGIAICFDGDFPAVARTLVRNGAELLVVPTFDAAAWTSRQHDQHAAMVTVRAVENDRWLLRATSSGLSQVLDPCGRDHGRIRNFESGLVFGLVAPRQSFTPYTRLGWLLGPLALAVVGGLVAVLVWPDLKIRCHAWRRRTS